MGQSFGRTMGNRAQRNEAALAVATPVFDVVGWGLQVDLDEECPHIECPPSFVPASDEVAGGDHGAGVFNSRAEGA